LTLSREEEDARQSSGSASITDEEMCRVSAQAAPIQPLDYIESYDIDLLSPVQSGQGRQRTREVVQRRQEPETREQPTVQLPAKFRPLVETMRGIGKAVISVADIEGPLRTCLARLNESIESPAAYLARAADAQIIVYDKSSNYLRFRNRGLATAAINYV
jgi:hypothetical protein